MIPFYFFRKKAISPQASLYHSGLLDKVDYWGKVDREAVIDEIRYYSKMYALDWGFSLGLISCAITGLFLLLYVILDLPYEIDYLGIICNVVLFMLGALCGAIHILDQYREALDFVEGGNV